MQFLWTHPVGGVRSVRPVWQCEAPIWNRGVRRWSLSGGPAVRVRVLISASCWWALGATGLRGEHW